ncbi:hypothetical protein [Primorskyibacter flagellatus]|uniref:hypothetical protein n=1 Tax=Primorskyibacter flagellatus TaxID=1387277 RepID=UPI00117A0B0B|nr:hypothetical protein [Primorskyibacter flagellatus]
MRKAILAAIAVGLPVPVIAELVSFDCIYFTACTKGVECGSANFDLIFRLDTTANKAFVVGNNGLSEVGAYRGASGITFLEMLGSGAVQSTTVASDGSSSHSRNTIIAGTLTASQYVGNCDVGETR